MLGKGQFHPQGSPFCQNVPPFCDVSIRNNLQGPSRTFSFLSRPPRWYLLHSNPSPPARTKSIGRRLVVLVSQICPSTVCVDYIMYLPPCIPYPEDIFTDERNQLVVKGRACSQSNIVEMEER